MSFEHRRRAHLACLAVCALLAPPASADLSLREETLTTLRALPAKDSGIDLKVWINDGANSGVRLGDEIQYHFRAKKDAYLSVVHVDAHGVATVLYPSLATGDNRLQAGVEKVFPSEADGFRITVEPPVGLEDLFAVATLAPVTAEDLGLELGADDPVAVIEAARAPAFAKKLNALLATRPENHIAFSHTEQRVSGREGAEYSKEDIVAFFTTRTRAIRRPKLNLHINFESGSADLADGAEASLHALGEALRDPRLAKERFLVGGHTDDIGESEFNLELSRERAKTVTRFLKERHAVPEERFDVRAYGEAAPVENNGSDSGRRANRRVELQLAR